MVSEAQNRANTKFKSKHLKQYPFGIYDTTRPKMIEYLDSLQDRQAYMRHLIAMDMKSKGIETDGLDGEEEDPGICIAEDCTEIEAHGHVTVPDGQMVIVHSPEARPVTLEGREIDDD